MKIFGKTVGASILSLALILVIFLEYGCSARTSTRGETKTEEKVKFYLVGIGPGDADLITLRGLRAIEDADLIVCSKRAQEKFASYLKGKDIFGTSRFLSSRKDYIDLTEKELKKRREEFRKLRNEIAKAVRQAIKKGKTVAILQGADPFIYGGGGRACERYADLNPVVIPGLSSFNAANAALAKNVTRTKPTNSVILTTGESPVSYTHKVIEDLAVHKATMVIYMPKDLKDLVVRLSTHYPPQSSIAIVSCAGYKEKERVIKGTLEDILDKIGDEKKLRPYLVYVGNFLAHRYFKEKQ